MCTFRTGFPARELEALAKQPRPSARANVRRMGVGSFLSPKLKVLEVGDRVLGCGERRTAEKEMRREGGALEGEDGEEWSARGLGKIRRGKVKSGVSEKEVKSICKILLLKFQTGAFHSLGESGGN